ncbi:MAG: MBL fold metallo-hydrolase [Hymenobacter sp.]
MNLLPTREFTGGSTVGVMWNYLFHKAPDAPPRPARCPAAARFARPSSAKRAGHGARDVVRPLGQPGGNGRPEHPARPHAERGNGTRELGHAQAATTARWPLRPSSCLPIAAVLISHDHYDHLDYQTIRKIKDKVGQFLRAAGHWGAPAGLGRGPRPHHGNELGRQRAPARRLTLRCTPSRHFSGRGLTNRNSTLWCSWVVQDAGKRVFYTGDGGYGPHFAAIGRQFGPFDLALVECGQYNPDWAEIHMLPEQSVQAARDVRAAVMLPVHWGAFTEVAARLERAGAARHRRGRPPGPAHHHSAPGRTGNFGYRTAAGAVVGMAWQERLKERWAD